MKFDEIWDYLPHISGYQVVLTLIVSYYAMAAGFIQNFVIFQFYLPEPQCSEYENGKFPKTDQIMNCWNDTYSKTRFGWEFFFNSVDVMK